MKRKNKKYEITRSELEIILECLQANVQVFGVMEMRALIKKLGGSFNLNQGEIDEPTDGPRVGDDSAPTDRQDRGDERDTIGEAGPDNEHDDSNVSARTDGPTSQVEQTAPAQELTLEQQLELFKAKGGQIVKAPPQNYKQDPWTRFKHGKKNLG